MYNIKSSLFYFSFSFFITIIGFASNTMGFDLYFHALSVINYDSISTLNFSINFGFGDMPRYILFHYFLYFFSLLYIPPIVMIVIIHSYAVYLLINNEKVKEPLYFVSVFLLVFITTIYWSIAATVTLYFFYIILIDKELKNKPALFIALSCHYISLIFTIIYLIIYRKNIIKIIIFNVIIFLIAILLYEEPTKLCSFQSSYIYNIFNQDNFLTRVSYKLKEIGLIIVFAFFVIKVQQYFKNIYSKANLKIIMCCLLFLSNICVLSISWYLQENKNRHGVYSYINNNLGWYNKEIFEFGWLSKKTINNECLLMYNRL